jgi:8-oxo-dGTP diphosphatase
MPKVIASVKALIQSHGKYLFLYEEAHHDKFWDLPGGKIEYGESPENALLREIKEEVCLEVKLIKSVGVWWFYSHNSKHQVICPTFLCKLTKNSQQIDLTKNPANEHFTSYQWLSIEEVLEHPIKLNSSLQKLIEKLKEN